MDYTKKLGLKKKTTLQNITRNDAVRLVSLLEKEKAVLAGKLETVRKGRDAEFDGMGKISWCRDHSKGRCGVSETETEKVSAQFMRMEWEMWEAKNETDEWGERFSSVDGENLSLKAKIADLEAQLEEKAGCKVDGVFEVGDRVEIFGCVDNRNIHLNGKIATVTGEEPSINGKTYSLDGVRPSTTLFGSRLRHAPTCRECAAKQERVDELAQDVEMHRDRVGDVVSELNSERAHLNDYKTGATANIESYQREVDALSRVVIALNKMQFGEVV